jgi:hypothetical protein
MSANSPPNLDSLKLFLNDEEFNKISELSTSDPKFTSVIDNLSQKLSLNSQCTLFNISFSVNTNF